MLIFIEIINLTQKVPARRQEKVVIDINIEVELIICRYLKYVPRKKRINWKIIKNSKRSQ